MFSSRLSSLSLCLKAHKKTSGLCVCETKNNAGFVGKRGEVEWMEFQGNIVGFSRVFLTFSKHLHSLLIDDGVIVMIILVTSSSFQHKINHTEATWTRVIRTNSR